MKDDIAKKIGGWMASILIIAFTVVVAAGCLRLAFEIIRPLFFR